MEAVFHIVCSAGVELTLHNLFDRIYRNVQILVSFLCSFHLYTKDINNIIYAIVTHYIVLVQQIIQTIMYLP